MFYLITRVYIVISFINDIKIEKDVKLTHWYYHDINIDTLKIRVYDKKQHFTARNRDSTSFYESLFIIIRLVYEY